MINRHFIKMLFLFTGILLVGFAVIAVTGEKDTTANSASVFQNVLNYFTAQ